MKNSVPRFVLSSLAFLTPYDSKHDYEFSIRKGEMISHEVAVVAITAPSFREAAEAVLAWAARYAEAKYGDKGTAYPLIRTPNGSRMLIKKFRGSYALIENATHSEWRHVATMEAA